MDAITRFDNACRRKPVDRPPVWLMRQAGRYMASYQAVRKRVSFMELCRTPELACEVTMMPIDQLDVDAAILFSDILVPLEPMGLDVRIGPRGPEVTPPVRTRADIAKLRGEAAVADELEYVYEAVRLILKSLDGRVPLLGFAGAPLTLATYVIEGASSKNHHELKRFLYEEPDQLEALLDKLTTVVTAYVGHQVDAGVHAIQLFDTWGGILRGEDWWRFSGQYTARIMESLAGRGIPIIHYLQGGSHLWDDMTKLPCDVLSVDWRQSLGTVRSLVGDRYAIQGNLDPGILRAPESVIRDGVSEMLKSYGEGPGLVVNLGHGITPDVTVSAAKAMVDAVKEFGPRYGGDL